MKTEHVVLLWVFVICLALILRHRTPPAIAPSAPSSEGCRVRFPIEGQTNVQKGKRYWVVLEDRSNGRKLGARFTADSAGSVDSTNWGLKPCADASEFRATIEEAPDEN